MENAILEWLNAQREAAQQELREGRRAIEEMERRCDMLYGAIQAFDAMREKLLSHAGKSDAATEAS